MNIAEKEPCFIAEQCGDKSSNWIAAAYCDKIYDKNASGDYVSDSFTVKCDKKNFGGVIRQVNTVTNISDDTLRLKHVSSVYIKGIGDGGVIPWYDKQRFMIHHCYMTWQGEFQWRSSALSELGLYKASNHNPANVISISSLGSQMTSLRYPLVFIEDRELNQTWFVEIEASANWYIEIGVDENGLLYTEATSAYSDHDGWYVNLEKGEAFKTEPGIYGATESGVEGAIRMLCDYKRQASAASLKEPLVCFNDYMNCLWALPNESKLIPLIDKAAELGCEAFCIDAGWFIGGFARIGYWVWDDSLFPSYGFNGIIGYIKNRGMLPGVWLEVDSITSESPNYDEMKPFFLTYNKMPVGTSGRDVLDFRRKEVREYIMRTFDKLYSIGVRYIKNDYNQTTGFGCDGNGAASEALKESQAAFFEFIDSVREKYPDLIIELCASGAMRAGGAAVKHFHLLSTSDQEDYRNNPSILSGAGVCIQPEKCGIWAYPYPSAYEERETDISEVFDCKRRELYADGRETVFNAVSAMLGLFYLSGHVDMADEFNTDLIKAAISCYKDNRQFIAQAYPIFPGGFIGISESGIFCYGLQKDNRILLAVWRIETENECKAFDLSKYIGKQASARIIYPGSSSAEHNLIGGRLTVRLKENNSAVLFEIAC